MEANADIAQPDRSTPRSPSEQELDRALGACAGRQLWIGLRKALPRRAAQLAFDAAAARALRS
jgi:hypothetical protein